jgi:hypothetical protein
MRRIKNSHTPIVRNLALRVVLIIGLTVSLVGCSPTFNWRTLRLDSVGAQALMPCKPSYSSREVPLLDSQSNVLLHMQACDVGETTFAVSWLNVPAEQNIQTAMSRWLSATLASAGIKGKVHPMDWSVAGTDFAKRYAGHGERHDGNTLAVAIAIAQRGSSLVQLGVYGAKPEAREIEEFLQGLRW